MQINYESLSENFETSGAKPKLGGARVVPAAILIVVTNIDTQSASHLDLS
jgi:hypothetical protein